MDFNLHYRCKKELVYGSNAKKCSGFEKNHKQIQGHMYVTFLSYPSKSKLSSSIIACIPRSIDESRSDFGSVKSL